MLNSFTNYLRGSDNLNNNDNPYGDSSPQAEFIWTIITASSFIGWVIIIACCCFPWIRGNDQQNQAQLGDTAEGSLTDALNASSTPPATVIEALPASSSPAPRP